ncbi:MAG: HD domain-containing protein [Candidatus Margulisiibacteriota bacterium]
MNIPKLDFGRTTLLTSKDAAFLNGIWREAAPCLARGIRKDFVVHTMGVVKAMGTIAPLNQNIASTLLPAAILHDVGWFLVEGKLQKSNSKTDMEMALHLHIAYAPNIIYPILHRIGLPTHSIDRIADIVRAHKFQRPSDPDKQLLIDADGLSDVFKEQFWSDVTSYNVLPAVLLDKRVTDKQEEEPFFFAISRRRFKIEAAKRLGEIASR